MSRAEGVEPVPEGRAVVQVEHGALEPLDERVEVRRARWETVDGDPQPPAGLGELPFELRPAIDHHLDKGDAVKGALIRCHAASL